MNALNRIKTAVKAGQRSYQRSYKRMGNMRKAHTLCSLLILALILLSLNLQAVPALAQQQPNSGSSQMPTQVPVEPEATTVLDDGTELAIAWFDLSLELVTKTPGFTPPVASRAFGYLGVTLYETVQPGMDSHRSLVGQLNGLYRLPRTYDWAEYHWPSAANAALASMTRLLFATAAEEQQQAIEALELRFATLYQNEVDATSYRRSVAWGLTMADAIFSWSMNDGGHEGHLRNFSDGYLAPVGDNLWVPTPPKFSAALQPYWGENRPFVLISNNACPSAPPPTYSEEQESTFYEQAREVYEVVQAADPTQVEIARFWADDPGKTATPPGHWISILNQVLEQEAATLTLASESYAQVGIAVADSFITCWQTKYLYNVPRPITYIQRVIDPTWNTPVVEDPVITPPFPEYTSGHSVQSAAAATVLSALFGDDYEFTDNTHASLGYAPRTFASFNDAAQEAAISRLYGGIHYRAAIENGIEQGKCVGNRVLELRFGGE